MPPVTRRTTRKAAAAVAAANNGGWYKLSRGNRVLGGVQLHEGVNTDKHPWDPTPCVAGGLHMMREDDVVFWITQLTSGVDTVQRAEIVEGSEWIEWPGERKAKAQSLRLGPPVLLTEWPPLPRLCVDETKRTRRRSQTSGGLDMILYRLRTAAVCDAFLADDPKNVQWVPYGLQTERMWAQGVAVMDQLHRLSMRMYGMINVAPHLHATVKGMLAG